MTLDKEIILYSTKYVLNWIEEYAIKRDIIVAVEKRSYHFFLI